MMKPPGANGTEYRSRTAPHRAVWGEVVPYICLFGALFFASLVAWCWLRMRPPTLRHVAWESIHRPESCVVCLAALNSDAAVLPCKHVLHVNCARTWLAMQSKCPVCRHALPLGLQECYLAKAPGRCRAVVIPTGS